MNEFKKIIDENVVAQHMGFGDLPYLCRLSVYNATRKIMARQLRTGKNEEFGWTDISFVEMSGPDKSVCPLFFVAVFDGKIVQVKLTWGGIYLEGSRTACETMEEKLIRYLQTISNKDLLKNVDVRALDRKEAMALKNRLETELPPCIIKSAVTA